MEIIPLLHIRQHAISCSENTEMCMAPVSVGGTATRMMPSLVAAGVRKWCSLDAKGSSGWVVAVQTNGKKEEENV